MPYFLSVTILFENANALKLIAFIDCKANSVCIVIVEVTDLILMYLPKSFLFKESKLAAKTTYLLST